MNRLGFVTVAFVSLILFAASANAQQASRCADCHFAQSVVPAPDHLYDWDRSPHSRNGVGCEKCHGGNSTVFEKTLAHRDILNSGNRKSPVHRSNLPATCGSCHVGPFVAFQESRHYELLKNGDDHGPTCSTCHDPVAGQLLSPKALEKQCAECHGPKEVAPRAERARNARQMYESLNAVREQLKLANSMIKRVDDRQRRADLTAEYEQATVPMTRAINAGHKYVYAELDEHLKVAQERVEKLMARIANRAN
ncbi:MAG: multiheme c-type cytochrome [Vicinamibacterales bacterium]